MIILQLPLVLSLPEILLLLRPKLLLLLSLLLLLLLLFLLLLLPLLLEFKCYSATSAGAAVETPVKGAYSDICMKINVA